MVENIGAPQTNIAASQSGRAYKKPSPTNIVALSSADFDAVLFDMDGIVTKTASIHAAAWKATFDALLQHNSPNNHKPFDLTLDYQKYVDGKPRFDGVRSFLQSRNINLPEGGDNDPPGFNTVHALGNLKNQEFLKRLAAGSLEVYETTVALIQSLKKTGIKVAIITASENGATILKTANLLHIFEARVDGLDARRLNLRGKPAPDTFLEAARQLGVQPHRAVVVEDSEAGVQAGKLGGFGLVIGVDRGDHRKSLFASGADRVVNDLAQTCVAGEFCELPSMAVADLKISDKSWLVSFSEFVPAQEGNRESICQLGNGYLVTRAAAPQSRQDDVHAPGTYMAGLYNRTNLETASGLVEHEDLVNLPNWSYLTFSIDGGAWFDLSQCQILNFRQALNLREGILYRYITFADSQGRQTQLCERRFAHMRRPHLLGLETSIKALNWSGMLTIHTAIDGTISNIGTKLYPVLNRKHLQVVESDVKDEILYLQMQTTQSKIIVSEAARTRLFLNGRPFRAGRAPIIKPDYVAQEIQVPVSAGDRLDIQKLAAIYSSRDQAISESGISARGSLAIAADLDALIQEHVLAWRQLWQMSDLTLETTESIKMDLSLILHLHTFHLLQTASTNSIDLDIGIPARSWSEGYQGHVFWDDLFIFPFLCLRRPELAKAILKYRYRRLNAARYLASRIGLPGARFPWQSGSSGREETPSFIWYPHTSTWVPDYSHLQVHIDAAVVHNVWKYLQCTGDLQFMYTYGAEIIFEVARFFAHLARFNGQRQRYEIHGVVGPDEYHVAYANSNQHGINNNAYTNVMVIWTLSRALELVKKLPADHCNALGQRLGIDKDELRLWERVSRKMYLPLREDGLIVQFEGFDGLQKFPEKKGSLDTGRLQQLFLEQNGTFNQYQVVKQSDVLMLLYLFSFEELQELFARSGYELKKQYIPKNIKYYAPITANNSTLSRVALAWVLSRADRENAWALLAPTPVQAQPANQAASSACALRYPRAWEIFTEALNSDYMDIQGGTTREGIHIGAMGGTIDVVERCYTGIETRSDVLWINPHLPREMTRLAFNLQYREQVLQLEFTQTTARISAGHSSAKPVKIGFQDTIFELHAGGSRTFEIGKPEINAAQKQLNNHQKH